MLNSFFIMFFFLWQAKRFPKAQAFKENKSPITSKSQKAIFSISKGLF